MTRRQSPARKHRSYTTLQDTIVEPAALRKEAGIAVAETEHRRATTGLV
jgi:hypothetical protein